MPPARRSRSSGAAAKGSQKTLSFGASKVTKPSSSSSSAKKGKTSVPAPLLSKAIDVEIEKVDVEAGAAAEIKAEQKREKSAEEQQAARVSEAQIRRYWKEREAERRAPRVHQQELRVEEKILRLFDMSSQYGVRISMFLLLFCRCSVCEGWDGVKRSEVWGRGGDGNVVLISLIYCYILGD